MNEKTFQWILLVIMICLFLFSVLERVRILSLAALASMFLITWRIKTIYKDISKADINIEKANIKLKR